MYWSCDINSNETIPLNEIIPEYTHTGRLYYLKKGAVQFAEALDEDMKVLEKEIVNRTRSVGDDDF